MATRCLKLLLSISLTTCTLFSFTSEQVTAQTGDSGTQRSSVTSQKRSDTTLKARTAKFDEPDDGTDKPTMSSDDVLSLSQQNATTLMAQAEQALTAGHIAYGIKVARKCVEENPADVDARLVLARGLAEKYRTQDDKQSALLKECLDQYLYVARHGENDTFQSKFAQQKMFDLTGVRWHPWLTQNAYLKKALQGSGLVAGTVINPDR